MAKEITKTFTESVDITPPFKAFKRNDEWSIFYGPYMATKETFATPEDADKHVNNIDWNIIGTMVAIFYFSLTNAKENKE